MMIFRLVALLASVLAMPGLALAQLQPAHPPTRQSAPVRPGPAPAPAAATPAPAASPPVAAATSGPSLIDVNSADEKTLDSLPGVGPARTKLIIASRPYTDKQQLLDRKTVPSNVFAAIKDRVALVNVNKTSAADMAKILPNVGPVRSQQIVDKRPYATLQELVTKGALTQGVFDGLKGLITTGP